MRQQLSTCLRSSLDVQHLFVKPLDSVQHVYGTHWLFNVFIGLHDKTDFLVGNSNRTTGNRTTRRPPHHGKETQTAVVRSCLPFISPGQNHLSRHSERGKKTRRTKEEVGRYMRELTGLEFAKSQRAVENRGKWRKLAAKSSAVPQRPSR